MLAVDVDSGRRVANLVLSISVVFVAYSSEKGMSPMPAASGFDSIAFISI